MAKNLSPSLRKIKQEYFTKIGTARYGSAIVKPYGISTSSKSSDDQIISSGTRPDPRR